MTRLTYKSSWGDYGSAVEFDDSWDEKCALRNMLGKYEDLGYTPNELKEILTEYRLMKKESTENNV